MKCLILFQFLIVRMVVYDMCSSSFSAQKAVALAEDVKWLLRGRVKKNGSSLVFYTYYLFERPGKANKFYEMDVCFNSTSSPNIVGWNQKV